MRGGGTEGKKKKKCRRLLKRWREDREKKKKINGLKTQKPDMKAEKMAENSLKRKRGRGKK